MRKRGKNEQNVQIYFFLERCLSHFLFVFVDLMQKFKYCIMIHVKKWLQSFHYNNNILLLLVFITHVQHYYC